MRVKVSYQLKWWLDTPKHDQYLFPYGEQQRYPYKKTSNITYGPHKNDFFSRNDLFLFDVFF